MEQEGELNQLEVEAMAENYISTKLNDHPLVEHLPVIPLRSLKSEKKTKAKVSS